MPMGLILVGREGIPVNLHTPAIARKVLAKDLPGRLVEPIVIDFMARKRVVKRKFYQRGERRVFHFFLKVFFSVVCTGKKIIFFIVFSLLRNEKGDEEKG